MYEYIPITNRAQQSTAALAAVKICRVTLQQSRSPATALSKESIGQTQPQQSNQPSPTELGGGACGNMGWGAEAGGSPVHNIVVWQRQGKKKQHKPPIRSPEWKLPPKVSHQKKIQTNNPPPAHSQCLPKTNELWGRNWYLVSFWTIAHPPTTSKDTFLIFDPTGPPQGESLDHLSHPLAEVKQGCPGRSPPPPPGSHSLNNYFLQIEFKLIACEGGNLIKR